MTTGRPGRPKGRRLAAHVITNRNQCGIPTGVTSSGDIAVTCWCQESIVLVPYRQMLAKQTLGCGRPGCEAPA